MTPTKLTRLFAIAAALVALIIPSPAHASTNKSCPQFEPLLRKAGMPVRVFSFLMWRESRCVPKAIGWNYKPGRGPRNCRLAPARVYRHCRAVASFDSGLLQVNSSWTTVTAQICHGRWGDMSVLLKPQCNVAVAKFLYERGGGLSNWGMHD